jgi:riboflavin synthase alpha subunit
MTESKICPDCGESILAEFGICLTCTSLNNDGPTFDNKCEIINDFKSGTRIGQFEIDKFLGRGELYISHVIP